MSKKAKGSLLSRISAGSGYVSFCTVAVWFFSLIAAVDAAMIILGGVCCILSLLLAIVGVILGIIALCTLTPEEKMEKISKAGTTKNSAWTGIIGSLVALVLLATIFIGGIEI